MPKETLPQPMLYKNIENSTPHQPDVFRIRYRTAIFETVATVVRQKMNKKSASALVKEHATHSIPLSHRARFIEVVETELMSLHAGNFARYKIRPSEFATWYESWQ